MADSKLKIDIRRDRILELLRQNGKVQVSELSKELGATPVTIRNERRAWRKSRPLPGRWWPRFPTAAPCF